MHYNLWNKMELFEPFSCDVCDSQKDVFEGKPLQNLYFKYQMWKVILNASNRILQKKRIKRVKSNVFHVIIVAILNSLT